MLHHLELVLLLECVQLALLLLRERLLGCELLLQKRLLLLALHLRRRELLAPHARRHAYRGPAKRPRNRGLTKLLQQHRIRPIESPLLGAWHVVRLQDGHAQRTEVRGVAWILRGWDRALTHGCRSAGLPWPPG